MRIPSPSPPSSRLSKPAHWSRALLAGSVSLLGAASAFAAGSSTVVISQVYGGGGNASAVYTNDFIELHNISSSPVNLTGWSIQYASATGAAFTGNSPLSGTIPAGGYFLIQEQSGGAVGAALPTPDLIPTPNFNMSGTAGRVALSNSTALLSSTASSGATVVDFVGFGATAATSETAAAPAPSNTLSISRKDNGSTDTDNNSTDFAAGAAPAPKNVSSTPYVPSVPGAPVISSLTPANGATGVAVNTPLTIVFNKAVVKGTGNITVKLASNNAVVSIVDVTTAAVSVSGSTATITLPSSLAQSTNYYVNMDAGTFSDGANAFVGISSTTTWAFTTFTPDLTAPTLVSLNPANNATNIAPPSSLSITFSEPIQRPLNSGPMIFVKKLDGTVVAALDSSFFSSDVSTTGAVATIQLPSTLDYGLTYYVEIDPGALEDLANNPFAGFTGSTTWKFSTVDVPGLTTTPYTQTFSTYTSTATLPIGWSSSGPAGYASSYLGDWGSVVMDPLNSLSTLGGFKGNASVYGYHHTSVTNTSSLPLLQTLTLRNATGAVITDLTVAYKGRVNLLSNTRIPAYTVSVAGTPSSALAYSTSDGDNAQRNSSTGALSIPIGATFQISWSSLYPPGAGSARQIGISDVVVSATASTFTPTVASLSIPVPTTGSISAVAQANVIGSGGPAVTARGFVFSATSVNANPVIGGTGVTAVVDGDSATGAYSDTLGGLTPGTNYTVKAYATNSLGTSYTPVVTFNSLAPSPTLVTSYLQDFPAYTGANPAGWTAISDAVPPVQAYQGNWSTGTSGGFYGNVSDPGVLGYQHTSSTGNLTVTLRLVNGTGAILDSLTVAYKGRVARTDQGRSPEWSVSVKGLPADPDLLYSTLNNVDTVKTKTLTGLNIAAGAEFTITWTSDRGAGSNSSKQIGITGVSISTGVAPSGYAGWAATNAGGQASTLDFDNDGVKNGVEYFFGATGSSFTTNPQPVSGVISFPHPAATPGATYKVFTSTTLSSWTDVTASTTVNPTTGAIQYTLPTGQNKLFTRLEVVITP